MDQMISRGDELRAWYHRSLCRRFNQTYIERLFQPTPWIVFGRWIRLGEPVAVGSDAIVQP